jgi:hypothetical protein
MQISKTRAARRLAIATCAALFVVPGAAAAAPVSVDLTVEAQGQSLVPPSNATLTGPSTFATDKREPACGGTGVSKTLAGPTALGALIDASKIVNPLGPVGVSDKFSFGLLVCGIGSYTSSDSAFWLYKVNHVSPEVGGDQYAVKNGDKILWFFQGAAGENSGDELAIEGVPARAAIGTPFTVTVVSYSFNGAKSPAAGAKVFYGGAGDSTTTDANGKATITLGSAGYTSFRAGRNHDIPSPVVKSCVARTLSACSAVAGKRIYGTDQADSIPGTAGPDLVYAGAGNDSIDVRGGGKDRVDCGAGNDTARLDKTDRAAANCETVIKPKVARKHKK